MKQKQTVRFRQPTPDEQEILLHLAVEPVGPEQVEGFDQWVVEHPYLKSAQVVGEHRR